MCRQPFQGKCELNEAISVSAVHRVEQLPVWRQQVDKGLAVCLLAALQSRGCSALGSKHVLPYTTVQDLKTLLLPPMVAS